MSAQNAKDAADDFVAQLRLPAEAKGRKFQLVTFASDEDCRFFYPRRALDWQRQVTPTPRARSGSAGSASERISLRPDDYYAWLKEPHPEVAVLAQTASKREFADRYLKLLE